MRTRTVQTTAQSASLVLYESCRIPERLIGSEQWVEFRVGGILDGHGRAKETMLQSERVRVELLGQTVVHERIQ